MANLYDETDKKYAPLIYSQLAKRFNHTGDMKYKTAYHMADYLQYLRVMQPVDGFSDDEWKYIDQLQQPINELWYSTKGNHIYGSMMIWAMFEPILKNTVKFQLLSAHDFNIQILKMELPWKSWTYNHVPFASTFIIEKHTGDIVKLIYNGEQLALEGCAQLDCTLEEIEQILKKTLLSPQEINEQCKEKYIS